MLLVGCGAFFVVNRQKLLDCGYLAGWIGDIFLGKLAVFRFECDKGNSEVFFANFSPRRHKDT